MTVSKGLMEPNDELKKPADDTSSTEWKQVAEMAEQFTAEQVRKAPEYASSFYREALDVEKAFDNRRRIVESAGEIMSQKEFEKWEDELSSKIEFAEKELEKTDGKLETVAECEQAMIFSTNDTELHKTIEAQAGNFYRDRMLALREAIQSSDDKNSQKDLDYVIDFYSVVMDHLDYKYMSSEEVREYGYEEYERGRTRAHNATIERLNGMNDLAKKYCVRPFTVRNFWPSDLRDEVTQTPEISRVMRYDRDLVEEYYTIAFSSEVQRRKNFLDRQMRLGIH